MNFAAPRSETTRGAPIPARDHGRASRDVARADFDAEWDALLDPLPLFVPAADIAEIGLDLQGAVVVASGAEALREFLDRFEHGRAGVVAAEHGPDHGVRRREPGRQYEPVVVGVRHDETADEASRDAPRRREREALLPFGVEEFDAARLREVLSEEVRGAGLKGFAILHHRFDRVRVDGAREALARGLRAANHGHRHVVLSEGGVHVEHLARLFARFSLRRVRGVPLLPEELRGAEEEARAELPTHHVRPLVDEQRQVAVALHPLRERRADDRLRGGTNDERLLELCLGIGNEPAVFAGDQAVVSDDRAFLREPLDVLGFLLEEALGDEQRKVGVLVPGGLEHAVEDALDVFPDGVAPGLDHHATAYRRSLRQIGGANDFLVPLRVVFGAGR